MINEKQQQVIDEQERNILLLASAGTGKTNTLANRISKTIQENKAKAEEILCITFTNKACKEMKERIMSVCENAENVEVRTFHSLCFEIIKKEAKKNTDVITNFVIYDEDDCLTIIEETFDLDMEPKYVKMIIDFIKESRMNYNFVTINVKRDLKNTIRKLSKNKDLISSFLSRFGKHKALAEKTLLNNGVDLVIDYNANLTKNGALDFNDLIINTLLLFKDEEIVNQIAAKYKYINIDEIQDTSLVEYNLIEKIFKDSYILLCGDVFQTIYEWRGSSPDTIIRKFTKKYSPIKISFDKNYRATKKLTECSNDYLNKAFPKEVKKILKGGLESNSIIDGEKISFHTSFNSDQEAKWIYSQIMSLPKSERNKVCILTRNNSYNQNLSKSLRSISKGILSFALIDDTKFFRKQEIKDIIAFLKLAINRSDGTALKRIIKRLPYDINEDLIEKIESVEYRNSGIMITDFIDKDAVKNSDKFSLLEKELKNNNVIVFDVESTGTDTTRDEIIQIAAIKINAKGKEIGRFVKFLKPNKSVGSSQKVHGFSDEFLEKEGEDKEKILNEFLEFVDNKTLVGHNVQYDINILKSELERNNLKEANFKSFFDTLDIYRRFLPSLENHKLCTISSLIDTLHKPNHNALYDILATGEILVHAVDNFIKPTKKERKKLMKANVQDFKKVSKDLNKFFSEIGNTRPMDIITKVVLDFNLLDIYGQKTEESDNMREFYFTAKAMDDKNLGYRDALIDFVAMTTLSDGEMEKLMLKKGKIPIITIHQAKGLEFEYIFLAGLQENVFPNSHAVKSDSIEEEKRVFYVAITRAKKKLYMSYSKYRRGGVQEESRLLSFLDNRYLVRA